MQKSDDHARGALIQWITSVVIGLVIALVICIARGLFGQTDAAQIFRILSDAALVPGVVLTGIGILSLIASDGFFDGISYGFSRMKDVYKNISSAQSESGTKSYYDYKQAKKKKRGKRKYYMVVIGACFIVLSVIFLQLYANA